MNVSTDWELICTLSVAGVVAGLALVVRAARRSAWVRAELARGQLAPRRQVEHGDR
jgi:hypothetical protein